MLRPVPRRASAACAAVSLAALSLALPAQAAQKKPSPTSAKTQSTAKTSSSARSPGAAKTPAAAPATSAPMPAAVVTAPPESAAPRTPPWPGSFAISAGYWSGLDVAKDLGNGVVANLDYGFERTPPSWNRFELEWHLVGMFARPTEKTPLTRTTVVGFVTTTVSAGVEKKDAYVIEVAPTVRVRLPVSRKLALFADAGLGIAQTLETYDREEMFVGHTVKKQNVTGVVLRLGLGLSLDLSERMRLLLLPLAVSEQLGIDYSGYEPTLALAFRL